MNLQGSVRLKWCQQNYTLILINKFDVQGILTEQCKDTDDDPIYAV